MIIGVNLNGFGEVLNGLWVVFSFIGLVSLVFVMVGEFLVVH